MLIRGPCGTLGITSCGITAGHQSQTGPQTFLFGPQNGVLFVFLIWIFYLDLKLWCLESVVSIRWHLKTTETQLCATCPGPVHLSFRGSKPSVLCWLLKEPSTHGQIPWFNCFSSSGEFQNTDLPWFDLRWHKKWYTFASNCTSKFEFWSFPGQVICSTIHSHV